MNLIPRSYFLDGFLDDFGKTKVSDMKCDIYEENDNYIVLMDVPGFTKEEINIDVDRGYLTVSLVRNVKEEKQEKNYIRKERFYGTTRRQFYVPNAMEENIKASFNDGVLKVVIPKREEELNKRKIDIE